MRLIIPSAHLRLVTVHVGFLDRWQKSCYILRRLASGAYV
jgi:dienelactone hydrolase